jgi:succinyl-CoA synthetase beta subunit
MQLVTHQTGPEGQKVRRLYIEQGLAMERELYLGAVVDRDKRRIAFMASTEGGVEIEKVAHDTPEKILTVHVDPTVGLSSFQSRELAFGLGLMQHGKETVAKFVRLMSSLYELCVKEDCSLLEINPLVVLKNGDVIALDSKINFDDNADFRHKNWAELMDKDEEDPVELEAKHAGLNYVSLDGNVGFLVNGAGHALATLHMIKHAGEKDGVAPANFLDVGGGLCHLHAAALAATARVDLRFHHDELVAGLGRELLRVRLGLVDGEGCVPLRDRDAVLLKDLLALVFVDLHERWRPYHQLIADSPVSCSRQLASGRRGRRA